MRYTENFRLKKPEQTDSYNVDDFNENADILDRLLTPEDISDKFTITPVNETGGYISGIKRISVYKQGKVISGSALIDGLHDIGELPTFLFNIPAEYKPKTTFVALPCVCTTSSGGFYESSVVSCALQGTFLSFIVFDYSITSVQISFNYICQ